VSAPNTGPRQPLHRPGAVHGQLRLGKSQGGRAYDGVTRRHAPGC